MTNKNMERCSTSFFMKKIQIKSVGYCYMFTGMAKTKQEWQYQCGGVK